MLDWLRQDAGYAIRTIRHQPGFFALAVASLALGIGANTAIFSFFDAVMLDPLPYEDPGELVHVWETTPSGETMTVSPRNYLAWREGTEAFEELAAFNIYLPVMRGRGEATSLQGSVVAPHFFDLIGVRPALGTGFGPEHGEVGNDRVALLSDALWRTRFGADPDVVGQTVRLDGATYTILGVLPADYRHPERDYAHTQIWVPLALGEADAQSGRYLRVLGRLRDGVGMERARSEMEAMSARLTEADPQLNEGWGVRLVRLDDQLYGNARPGLVLMLGAAGFVLLVVCVNVANLMLARSQRRSREFAIRAAVGGSRGRLVRQVLVEASLVVAVGGALGLALVALSLDVLRAVQASYVSWLARLDIDLAVVGFMMAVSGLTVLAVGLVPAIRSARPELRGLLLSGSTPGARSRRGREALIVAELALTVVLLVSAALLGRSFLRLTGTDIGFASERALTMELEMPVEGYDADRVVLAYDQVLERVRALPGVEAAGLVSDLPFTSWNSYTSVSVERPPEPDEQLPSAEVNVVGGAYFRAMGMDRLRGDLPAPAEEAGGREGVVINQAMARSFWGDADPMEATFYIGSQEPTPAVVVGVVSDILDDGFGSRPEARMYRSHGAQTRRGMVLVVRTAGSPLALASPVRGAIHDHDLDIAIDRVQPLSAVVDATVAGRRLVLAVVLVFGALALVLAGVGIFGVVSYAVSERTSEMAIRSAMGADRLALVRMVLRHSVGLAGLGLAIGVGLGLVAGRVIRGLLYGITVFDPVSYLVVALVLSGTALLAAWLPARRASRIEPAEALRLGSG